MSRPNDWQKKDWLERQLEPQEGSGKAFLFAVCLLLLFGGLAYAVASFLF